MGGPGPVALRRGFVDEAAVVLCVPDDRVEEVIGITFPHVAQGMAGHRVGREKGEEIGHEGRANRTDVMGEETIAYLMSSEVLAVAGVSAIYNDQGTTAES